MKHFLLAILGLLIYHSTYAQRTITGTVLLDDIEPAIGANISVPGFYDVGTVTDFDGNFSLEVPNDVDTIAISFTGFNTQYVSIVGKDKINAVLLETICFSPIVIQGSRLFTNRYSHSVGFSLQSLDTEELSQVKSTNWLDNLGGQIAGVQINQGATGVGSTTQITIRGETSFTNNNPLFVVDGTPINNNTNLNFSNEAAAGFQEIDFGNGAMELNQDDIETVTVLKGATAAALYGTRAANGVIYITTKGGTYRNKVEFNTSTFIDKPFRLPQFQNLYGQGNSGQFEFVDGLGGGTNDNITYSWGPALDQGNMIPQFDSPVILNNGDEVRGGDVAVHGGLPITATPFVSHHNNLKNFYETGLTSINNLAFSGGNEDTRYRISLTDLRSKSYIPGVNLNRQSVATKVNYKPFEKVRIESSINYIHSNSDNRPSSGYGSENINYSLVAWGPRSMNIESLKDYWQPGLEGVQQYSFNYTFFDNPYFILNENTNSFNKNRLINNLEISVDITEDLTFYLSNGLDYSNDLRKMKRHFSTNRFKNGAYAEQNIGFTEVNTDFLFNYNKYIDDDWQIDVSFGGNRMNQKANSQQTETLSLAQPGVFNFSNAASPINVFQANSHKRINSLYSWFEMKYRGIFFLEVSGRNDWSSALATPLSTQNTSIFYPAISSSWIISEWFDSDWLYFLKLRTAWAQVGNDTAPYQTSTAFVAGTSFNAQPTFTAQSFIANTNLKPERTSTFEAGLDIRLFYEKLNIDITYYNSIIKNQIISFPVPISSGFNQEVVNGGAVRSQGIEMIVYANWLNKRDVFWATSFNFHKNRATVESLPEGADKITLAYSRVYDNVNQTVWFQVEEGGQIGDMYGTGYLKNENGDFIIDNNGKYIADNTLQKLGNYNPDFVLGMNNNFRYKDLSVSFLWDWHQGGQIVSRTLSLAAVGGQLEETAYRPEVGIVADGVVNVGTSENPVWEQNTTAVSAESYYRQFYDRNHEENNVYDATYLKLRQASIAYNFEIKNQHQFTVSLIGRNLLAFSKIPHFDPEQLAVQGNQFINGVEDMSYPSARSFGLKLQYVFQ